MPKLKTFDFLDTYRGFAAFMVVVVHVAENQGHTTMFHAFFVAVPAFFQLSAFLLTYRLIIQYEHAGSKFSKLFQITLKYMVIRFFRIYLTFVIYCAITFAYERWMFPEDDFLARRMVSCALLGSSIMYPTDWKQFHLWTIPIEVCVYIYHAGLYHRKANIFR